VQSNGSHGFDSINPIYGILKLQWSVSSIVFFILEELKKEGESTTIP